MAPMLSRSQCLLRRSGVLQYMQFLLVMWRRSSLFLLRSVGMFDLYDRYHCGTNGRLGCSTACGSCPVQFGIELSEFLV
jgi:hypothetical protein